MTGMNFRVDTSRNTWVCFHGGSHPPHGGGGPAELIAVQEGIIGCGQAGSNCFTAEQGRQVIQVAREKYGLKAPEKQMDLTWQPKGWALSINITKMALKYGLVNCPNCYNQFRFTDSHGLFYCQTCKYGGGLKKFAELIVQKAGGEIKR